MMYSLISAFIYDPLDDPWPKDREMPAISLEINNLPPMYYYKINEGKWWELLADTEKIIEIIS